VWVIIARYLLDQARIAVVQKIFVGAIGEKFAGE
jgi:hypothetical protein